jgi:hypothetical protein
MAANCASFSFVGMAEWDKLNFAGAVVVLAFGCAFLTLLIAKQEFCIYAG